MAVTGKLLFMEGPFQMWHLDMVFWFTYSLAERGKNPCNKRFLFWISFMLSCSFPCMFQNHPRQAILNLEKGSGEECVGESGECCHSSPTSSSLLPFLFHSIPLFFHLFSSFSREWEEKKHYRSVGRWSWGSPCQSTAWGGLCWPYGWTCLDATIEQHNLFIQFLF